MAPVKRGEVAVLFAFTAMVLLDGVIGGTVSILCFHAPPVWAVLATLLAQMIGLILYVAGSGMYRRLGADRA